MKQSAISGLVLLCLTLTACNNNTPSADSPLDSTETEGTDSGQHLIAATASNDKEERAEIPFGQLPNTATPVGYALELNVIPGQPTFQGHVDIAVQLHEPAEFLYLHGQSLDVSRVVVLMPDGDTIEARYEQVHEDGIAKVSFARSVSAGPIGLEFDYEAKFGTRLHGLYAVEEGGEHYAFTQMESIYAREAFPGFDQPSFKTPFELSVVTKAENEVVANAPASNVETLPDGLKRVRFAPTPPITTYMVALAVGPLDIVEGKEFAANTIRSTALPFRGVAIKGKGQDLAHAMNETGRILDIMEAYFDYPYPYAKLDIIAVPDFEAGAMENPGAITFREKLLLLKPNAPPQQKGSFASVMAHELAHMWFGDLVTMPWWDDIWLNESFATWMATKAIEEYDPTQNSRVRELRRTRRAQQEDALISARQIREPVTDNDGIVEAFDGITYAKGGAVLGMFEEFIGEDVFREAIRQHMKNFAHGSADINDLITSLSTAYGKNLQPSFNSFLLQNGIPNLDVSIDCKNKAINVAQSRYLPKGTDGDPDRQWIIPVCLKLGTTGGVAQQCQMVSEQEEAIAIEGGCPDWVMPSADAAGYYHWSLSQDDFDRLMAAGDKLTEREWLGVAGSVRAGLDRGAISVGQVWDIAEVLSQSRYESVARTLMPTMRMLEERLGDDPKIGSAMRGKVAEIYRNEKAHRVFSEAYNKTIADVPHQVHLASVASFMAEVARDAQTRAAALEKANLYLKRGEQEADVNPATLEAILTVGVQDGGRDFFDTLLEQFHGSSDANFRDTALDALAKTRDREQGETIRELALSDQLRANEIRRLIEAHVAEKNNVGSAWTWLNDNFDELAKKMPSRHVAKLTKVARTFCDLDSMRQAEQFFRPRLEQIDGGRRSLDVALESMQLCSATISSQREQAKIHFLGGTIRR